MGRGRYYSKQNPYPKGCTRDTRVVKQCPNCGNDYVAYPNSRGCCKPCEKPVAAVRPIDPSWCESLQPVPSLRPGERRCKNCTRPCSSVYKFCNDLCKEMYILTKDGV